MSELFKNGLLIIGACAAGIGTAALLTSRVLSTLVNALPNDAKRTFDDLVKLIETEDEQIASTPKEEVEKVKSNQKKIEKANHLMENANPPIKQLALLSTSPLRYHLTENDLKYFDQESTEKDFERLYQKASKSMEKFQFKKINTIILQAAQTMGFKNKTYYFVNNQFGVFSLVNDDGRAVIAKTNSSPDGTKIDLDVTGYPQGECQKVMDQLLSKIEEKGVEIRTGHRMQRNPQKSVESEKIKSPKKKKRQSTKKSRITTKMN
jgi:hypothetical protein